MSIRQYLQKAKANYYTKKRLQSLGRYFDNLIKDIMANNNSFVLEQLDPTEIDRLSHHGWSTVMPLPITKASLGDYMFYKTLEGFNAQYLPLDIFIPIVIRTLNPSLYYPAFQHKGLYSSLYNTLPQPKTFLKVFDGIWYDEHMQNVDKDDLSIFRSADCVIIKPMGDFGGHGVKIVDAQDCQSLKDALNQSGRNFVCQEVVEQSEKTKCFCSTSLNTFRVTTLFINGRCTFTNILFRHGREGSVVDNGAAGGIMIGVDKDGRFRPYGYDKYVFRYDESPLGIKYADIEITEVKQITELVVRAHQELIPMCGVAGWDIGLDKNNEPVFIEVNLGDLGIRFEQLCSAAPIFGERTQEVIDYVRKNKSRLNLYRDINCMSIV